jgi:hypothetical protein
VSQPKATIHFCPLRALAPHYDRLAQRKNSTDKSFFSPPPRYHFFLPNFSTTSHEHLPRTSLRVTTPSSLYSFTNTHTIDKMGKTKETKTGSKSKSEVTSLSAVKNSSVTKPSQTPIAKSKQVAKDVASKVNGKKEKASKPVVKAASPSSSDDSDSSASESEAEVPVKAAPATATNGKANGKTNGKTNGVAKKEVDTSESSSSSDSSDDDSEDTDSDSGDEKPAASDSEDDSNSDDSGSDSEEEAKPVAAAKPVEKKVAPKAATNGSAKGAAKTVGSPDTPLFHY